MMGGSPWQPPVAEPVANPFFPPKPPSCPMAIRIKARAGESAEQMLRRFKKLCEKEGLTKDIKKRQYYEKPSEKKQRQMRRTPSGLGRGGGRGGR